jgi:hypothetical protein
MAKKDVTYRPMFGYEDASRRVTSISKFIDEGTRKDALITELRAKLSAFEAQEEKRRVAAREGMRKRRADAK